MSFQHEPSSDADRAKFDHEQGRGRGPSPRLVAAAIVAVLIVAFVIANGHATRINFVVFKWDTTVRWSIFIAALLGAGLDRLMLWGKRHHKKEHKNDE
jgi:uncharacterized integral membrane protein